MLPVFEEEDLLPELQRRLLGALEPLGLPFELLYVDDGSRDGSLAWIRALAATDPRVKLIALSRNFGHQVAITAGLDHASGEAVVLIDSDLQDPPEVIPELVARWREGLDVVYARRRARPGESALKRSTAFLFYRFLRALTRVDIPPDTGDFRLLSRPAADALIALRERRRFVRGLVSWVGFRQGEVLFDRHPRAAGHSKYSLRQMLRLALSALVAFSDVPITSIGVLGGLVCLGALAAPLFGAALRDSALFLLGGVQLLALWLLGQYLGPVAEEARGRPLYFVRERSNLDVRQPGRGAGHAI